MHADILGFDSTKSDNFHFKKFEKYRTSEGNLIRLIRGAKSGERRTRAAQGKRPEAPAIEADWRVFSESPDNIIGRKISGRSSRRGTQ